MEKSVKIYYPLSQKETRRFRGIILDNLMQSASIECAEQNEYDGIGRLAEKQMHAALKSFICPDRDKHEIKIQDSPLYIAKKEENTKNRKYVADILDGDTIYEIQTGGFSPLREKIKWILESTAYNVVLIHPIAQTKWVNKIDNDGKISGRRRSPAHGRIEDIADQLYFIKEFLPSPRFSMMVLMMEAEQYVKPQTRGRRLKKYELIPVSLLGAYLFRRIDDYRCFLPDTLPEVFTVKDFSSHTKIYGQDAYSVTNTLREIGLIEESGSIGRAKAYRKK